MVLPIHSRTAWPPIYFRISWSSSFPFRTAWSSLPMAATPWFKSQCPSSFAAPFLTPPTVSYTCQHPHILSALLGCYSKSEQVWPHGMEPIISKLSCRPYNQGELLSSAILDRIRSHPPGSKHGHSYLTYLWTQFKVIDMLNDQPEVSCKAVATENSSEWLCSMCPIPPGSSLWGWGHPIYIFLIFPGHLEFWTPLQIPSWGSPLVCTLLQ